MAGEALLLLTGAGIPNASGVVRTRRQNVLPVCREVRGGHAIFVTF